MNATVQAGTVRHYRYDTDRTVHAGDWLMMPPAASTTPLIVQP
ncbi:MAG: hypothetical protein ABIP57_00565 [Jatrophihabitantaceae bacterium]